MSLVINVEKFPNFPSILEEIERLDRENRLRDIPVLKRDAAKIQNQEGKTRSSAVEPRQTKQAGSRPVVLHHSIDPAILRDDTRLTENAEKLSNEELALLYEDILKPLDFYLILHERRNQLTENEEICC